MLGEFTITGIERAKRGEPKVQVQFDLDANGMLKVSAMDKATGAENHIVITNSKARPTQSSRPAPSGASSCITPHAKAGSLLSLR